MGTYRTTLKPLLALCILGLGACASDRDAAPGDSPRGEATKTRSEACLAWQNARCVYKVDKCHLGNRQYCDSIYTTLFCRSDSAVSACTEALKTASCDKLPDVCIGVTGPEPAIAYCNEFVDAVCSKGEECGKRAKSDCVAEAAEKLHCSKAIGAKPSIEQCITEVRGATCDQISAMPESCKHVLKTSDVAVDSWEGKMEFSDGAFSGAIERVHLVRPTVELP